MSKVVIFGHIPPNFFVAQYFFPVYLIKLLLPIIFYLFRPKKLFFRLYRPKNCLLALKNLFLDQKKIFLDLLDLKISLNQLKTLRKHLFSLQIDEKNNIFLNFTEKNCPNYYNAVKPKIEYAALAFIVQDSHLSVRAPGRRSRRATSTIWSHYLPEIFLVKSFTFSFLNMLSR